MNISLFARFCYTAVCSLEHLLVYTLLLHSCMQSCTSPCLHASATQLYAVLNISLFTHFGYLAIWQFTVCSGVQSRVFPLQDSRREKLQTKARPLRCEPPHPRCSAVVQTSLQPQTSSNGFGVSLFPVCIQQLKTWKTGAVFSQETDKSQLLNNLQDRRCVLTGNRRVTAA